MALLNYSIKNMIGGVSRQPPSVRLQNQCEEMINCVPSVTDFLKRRSGSRHISLLLEQLPRDAFVDFIVRGENDTGLLVITGGIAVVYDLKGGKAGHATSPYIYTENPKEDLRLLTVNDYNFILNVKKTVVLSEQPSPAYASQGGFVFVKQAVRDVGYIVTVDDSEFRFARSPGDTKYLDATVIAEELSKLIRLGAGVTSNPEVLATAFPNTQSGAIIWIKDLGGKKLEAADSMSGAYIKAFKNSTAYFNELPVVAPNGYVMEITGDPASRYDNYYVQFVTDNGEEIGKGYWKETTKEGKTHNFDISTMPVALTVTEKDGVKFEPIPWKGRLCGDELLVPSPSFTGNAITDIFFYRNRLCFLTGDNVCMSEAGEFFNFFATTATALLDSDPIDVAAGGGKVANLKYAVPFNEGLFIYSDRTLFVAEHGDVLSASSLSIKPIGQFDTSLTGRPAVMDVSIFYITDSGGFTAIREFMASNSGDLYGYSNDISEHVPGYIPAGVRKIAVSMEEACVFAIGSGNEIYVYNYQNGSDRARVQSAWGKWVFAGEVVHAEAVKGRLYLVIRYPEGVFLESIDLSGGDGNFKDRRGYPGGELNYISRYVYSLQHLRFKADSPTITAGRTQLRTLTIRYTDTEGFKLIIERKGRKPEERFVTADGDGEKRFSILARNEDVKIAVESVEDKQFKLTESRVEAVFANRNRLLG